MLRRVCPLFEGFEPVTLSFNLRLYSVVPLRSIPIFKAKFHRRRLRHKWRWRLKLMEFPLDKQFCGRMF